MGEEARLRRWRRGASCFSKGRCLVSLPAPDDSIPQPEHVVLALVLAQRCSVMKVAVIASG
jgi:hypothetical protein